AAKQRAYREANPGRNAEACKRLRERRKALEAKETKRCCDICGIGFDRAKRVRGTNTCLDCFDTYRGIV
ncbi:hypothetical protein, partial [Mycobacterium marinum]